MIIDNPIRSLTELHGSMLSILRMISAEQPAETWRSDEITRHDSLNSENMAGAYFRLHRLLDDP